MTQALKLVVRGLNVLVRHQQHGHALLEFDLGDFGALFIEQEGGHFHRHLNVHSGCVVLHGLFLNDAQDLQGRGFGIADVACAVAAWASDVRAFGQCRAQALARHFQQAELADRAELNASAVKTQRITQALFHFTTVLGLFHVDEVHDDQTTQIAQTHLAGNFVSRFQVGAEGGFFDVAATCCTGRVHVHSHQGFGVVDHDGAARRQVHCAAERRFDLVLDLEAREQRGIVTVALDAVGRVGHDVQHELQGLLVNVVGIDQDFTDVGGEVVADGADDQ